MFAGTQKDNVIDCAIKGRHKNPILYGEQNPGSKLSKANVVEIRHLSSAGCSNKELATNFNVTERHVRRIISKKRWAQII